MKTSRREFVQAVTAAGAGMALSNGVWAANSDQPKEARDDINIALIGVGEQGEALKECCIRIPGVRIKAVCDIWEYPRKVMTKRLGYVGHKANGYEDYREMLATEKDLDAVVIATPDWMHAEHSNACMEAGLHVYCEKEMSNSLEKAKSMLETSRRTGKLLQIGHQRRSNPRYKHAINTLIHDMNILGRVTHANAQWNRGKSAAADRTWPVNKTMSKALLEKYGYASMQQFRNWRWYKRYGGGPIVDLGSHQIDIFAWVFGVNPSSVIASGGVDYYHHHEWYDNVMVIYEYKNEYGTSRAFYQTLTTSKHGGFNETLMGENGTVVISEMPPIGNFALREPHAPKWDVLVSEGYLNAVKAPMVRAKTKNVHVDVRVSPQLTKWPLPIELLKPAHQPHLENFFNAIRSGEELNCPGEVGYETAVAVLACNEAVRTRKEVTFKESDFHV